MLQRDGAFVDLGQLVSQGEDTLSSHGGIEHAVDLLRHLCDGLGEALVQLKEGNNGSQRDSPVATQGQRGTHDGNEHITQVAQVGVDGHDDIGNAVGATCRGA